MTIILTFIGICFIGIFIISLIISHTSQKKTIDNVWKDKNNRIFVVIGFSNNFEKVEPIKIQYIGSFETWVGINSESFYKHLGTKKTKPEYFL